MKNLTIPAFCETNYEEHQENRNSKVYYFSQTAPSAFEDYGKLFEEHGFSKKEEYRMDSHRFAAYFRDGVGIFVNSFGELQEMSIVVEQNCAYFSYSDENGTPCATPQITQIALDDFGMSYVVRLSDGRFIILDGGYERETEADKLFACLQRGNSRDGLPVIAAWIMTHPHTDHFHCFMAFMEKYAGQVTIEKFLFLFPEADDTVHYPKLMPKETPAIPRMLDWMARTDAAVYSPHTGQEYRIGDAVCRILASMDDTIHRTQHVNSTSLVIRMELGGQVILWATDAYFRPVKLSQKYGTYLKSDILQVPHHGFSAGGAQEQVNAYKLIDAPVCLLPNNDYIAFTWHSIFSNLSTRYLFADSPVAEVITGDVQRTIDLPYFPRPEAKKELARKYLSGMKSNGSPTWVFSDLQTSRPEDLCYTILNMTRMPVTVRAELYFEDPAWVVRHMTIEVPAHVLRQVTVTDAEPESDALCEEFCFRTKTELPENAAFAVRFLSSAPVVITNKNHKESYRAETVG